MLPTIAKSPETEGIVLIPRKMAMGLRSHTTEAMFPIIPFGPEWRA